MRTTFPGTVLSIRSRSVLQVDRKTSLEAAILRIVSPPSELKIRESERVVTFCPATRGFAVVLLVNSVALFVAQNGHQNEEHDHLLLLDNKRTYTVFSKKLVVVSKKSV